MLWPLVYFGAALATGATEVASADFPTGKYICTVDQKAGIAEEHMEGADPPAAFIDRRVTRFAILVSEFTRSTDPKAKFRVEEIPYKGPDRDTKTWQTKSSVLHATYLGNGWNFTSVADQAFLRLDIASTESGWLKFYHAGFENPDIDNVNLSVRSGTCAPVK